MSEIVAYAVVCVCVGFCFALVCCLERDDSDGEDSEVSTVVVPAIEMEYVPSMDHPIALAVLVDDDTYISDNPLDTHG